MTSSAAWAVQIGIYERLSTDAGLAAIGASGVGVYDQAPEEAGFPFLTIGAARCFDYQGVPGALEHDIRIRAYSRWGGRAEVKAIEGAVTAALHDASFPLDGHALRQCRFVFADILRRPEQDTFQAVMRFRLVTEQQGANT